MRLAATLGFLLALLSSGIGWAHDHKADPPKTKLAVSVVFDGQHRLWRASVQGGQVVVDVSIDEGKTFGRAVAINSKPEKIGAEGELRPKIALGRQGEVYVSWTQALDKPYAGNIMFSRSLDDGKSFSSPIIVNHNRDAITHRFDALAVADDGTVYVAWIDKRDLHAAQQNGSAYAGAAVYYAVSSNRGATFAREFKAGEHTCECCRIALAPGQNGNVAALWRHLFDGSVRDHAIAVLTPDGVEASPRRASFGNWNIDACPHHGPALARAGESGWHMAWYDGGEKHGLYYARMDGKSWASSPPLQFGNREAQAGHPALLAQGERVWLAWQELSEHGTRIRLMKSEDGGLRWGAPVVLASVGATTDYPVLVEDGPRAYLSLNTGQGYRLIPLENAF